MTKLRDASDINFCDDSETLRAHAHESLDALAQALSAQATAEAEATKLRAQVEELKADLAEAASGVERQARALNHAWQERDALKAELENTAQWLKMYKEDDVGSLRDEFQEQVYALRNERETLRAERDAAARSLATTVEHLQAVTKGRDAAYAERDRLAARNAVLLDLVYRANDLAEDLTPSCIVGDGRLTADVKRKGDALWRDTEAALSAADDDGATCATCGHHAKHHAVDDEERRECELTDGAQVCLCRQFVAQSAGEPRFARCGHPVSSDTCPRCGP